eukprot:TRINITY_DN10351_c0_g1_i1.p1 TRINITY_DN10351_c0_g1~~TRINITY_DN10351_c0_g1_i1.p1  ORF type:complete len:323 (+),score=78.46 TRINITY_DN10351_c0_g1_i1:53-1021(+)
MHGLPRDRVEVSKGEGAQIRTSHTALVNSIVDPLIHEASLLESSLSSLNQLIESSGSKSADARKDELFDERTRAILAAYTRPILLSQQRISQIISSTPSRLLQILDVILLTRGEQRSGDESQGMPISKMPHAHGRGIPEPIPDLDADPPSLIETEQMKHRVAQMQAAERIAQRQSAETIRSQQQQILHWKQQATSLSQNLRQDRQLLSEAQKQLSLLQNKLLQQEEQILANKANSQRLEVALDQSRRALMETKSAEHQARQQAADYRERLSHLQAVWDEQQRDMHQQAFQRELLRQQRECAQRLLQSTLQENRGAPKSGIPD